MYQKERKLNPVLLIVLAAALLAVGIAVWFLLTHVWVAGTFYSRNADVLDLRFADVTTADYDKLRKKAPNSEILWRIPFQGKTYDQASSSGCVPAAPSRMRTWRRWTISPG